MWAHGRPTENYLMTDVSWGTGSMHDSLLALIALSLTKLLAKTTRTRLLLHAQAGILYCGMFIKLHLK